MTLKILKKEDDFKNNLFPNMTLIILIPRLKQLRGGKTEAVKGGGQRGGIKERKRGGEE